MPFPMALARFNRRVTNPILGRLAGRVPPFVLVEHRGRRSGRRYTTPVLAFRRGRDWVFALTYGSRTDWVQNVLAADACRLKAPGGWRDLTAPRLLQGAEWRRLVPPAVRAALTLAHVDEFLRLTEAPRAELAG